MDELEKRLKELKGYCMGILVQGLRYTIYK